MINEKRRKEEQGELEKVNIELQNEKAYSNSRVKGEDNIDSLEDIS